MSGLLILGAGGHGRVVADAARACRLWADIAFLDDRHPDLRTLDGFPVLGPFSAASSLRERFSRAVVALGDGRARLRVLTELRQAGFELTALVHPGAVVSPEARLGEGTVVFAGCVINPGAEVGEGCIINTAASVDHDCRLGPGVHLSPGVHLGGDVTVGDYSWLGVGACVRNGIVIGREVMVGVGAAVVNDLPDGVTAVGVPARMVEENGS